MAIGLYIWNLDDACCIRDLQRNEITFFFLHFFIHRDNLVSDIFHGCFVVTCTLSAFISLVWLREQILHGGGPDWLDQEIQHEVRFCMRN